MTSSRRFTQTTMRPSWHMPLQATGVNGGGLPVIAWRSSRPAVATVTRNMDGIAILSAHAIGTARITATVRDAPSLTLLVTVAPDDAGQ